MLPEEQNPRRKLVPTETIYNLSGEVLDIYVEIWLKDERGMDDQEERMKNQKYRSLKMLPSDIILKFSNIIKFN